MNKEFINKDIEEMNSRRDQRAEVRKSQEQHSRKELALAAGAVGLAGAGLFVANHFGLMDHNIELDTNIGSDPARSTEAPEHSHAEGPRIDLDNNTATFPTPER